jgi:hypothetical protein
MISFRKKYVYKVRVVSEFCNCFLSETPQCVIKIDFCVARC